jgi:dihydroorotate dehydrogenase (NAD+) catalytic subunit
MTRGDMPSSSAAPAAGGAAPALTLTAGKRDLVLRTPLANAAGFLGCDAAARESLDFASLGGYITPPLSLQPRSAAHGPRLLTFPGGFLLHTGHPNAGLRAAIRQDRRRWGELPCPVVMHLLLRTPKEAAEMARWVESVEEISALELGLGEVDAAQAAAMVAACAGELPLIAQLPLGTPPSVFAAAVEAGAHAVSIGAPRGALPGRDGASVRGRLYGPAVFPLALQAVAVLKELLRVPILASGGVYRGEQVAALLSAGASAAQLDGVLWTTPERVFSGAAVGEG